MLVIPCSFGLIFAITERISHFFTSGKNPDFTLLSPLETAVSLATEYALTYSYLTPPINGIALDVGFHSDELHRLSSHVTAVYSSAVMRWS